ncbi:MAG: VWA domain-containing protein [Microscillaceae bacterium]|jgi:Ca-activated chloride channel family protein|nr:VWA domain-containing protein [Microscillaceae bacterium]
MDLQWYYSLTWVEYFFISVFGLALGLYLYRMWHLAQKLKSPKRFIFIKLPLRIIYFILLIIALIGPSFGFGKKFVQAVGKDIYILIDLSKSMTAADISPTRLEKVKYEIKNIIQSLETDRIGLIVFAHDAFLQCPLTYDRNALAIFLQNINPGLMPSGSTDFNPALQMAMTRHEISQNRLTDFKAKLVILVSDGEHFGSDTTPLIQQYKRKGLRLFTIGVGTPQGSRIPASGGFQLDKNGSIAISRLNYQKMEELATQTGGQYFEISPEKNQISQLIKTIQQVKGQRLDVRTMDVSSNKYEYFLWIALALIAIDIIFIVKVLKVA